MKGNIQMKTFSILAAALCCAGANAAEYFVATDGCDAADGSAAKPWRTIQRAADAAQAGDTVTIRGGTYRDLYALQFRDNDFVEI